MKPAADGDRVLLVHMRECLDRIQAFTEDSQRLSDEIKASEPRIPWRELAGFRNVVVHGYLGIDLAVVWGVVTRDLPPLAEAIDRMLARRPA